VSRRLRVLSISTLFPCPARPGFGGFVANAMTAVAPLGEIDLTVLNPIGLPPWPLSRREPYRALAATPAITTVDALTVHHPRFLALPALADGNPARLARATLPLVQQLQAAEPFDLVDAQFFFPDGPAAHTIARTLGLPLVIKARGADIHYWSARPAARRQILAAGAYAARLLAVSASLAEAMRGIGLPGETIRIHHTGLDHARFFPRPRARARAECGAALGLNAPADAPLFACVGALIPQGAGIRHPRVG